MTFVTLRLWNFIVGLQVEESLSNFHYYALYINLEIVDWTTMSSLVRGALHIYLFMFTNRQRAKNIE